MAGTQLVGVAADTLGGIGQLLRVDPNRLGHGEPFCRPATDATSATEGSICTNLGAPVNFGEREPTQFVNCQ